MFKVASTVKPIARTTVEGKKKKMEIGILVN